MRNNILTTTIVALVIAVPAGYLAGLGAASTNESADQNVTEQQQTSNDSALSGSEASQSQTQVVEETSSRRDVSVSAARDRLGSDHALVQEYEAIFTELDAIYEQYGGADAIEDMSVISTEDQARIRELEQDIREVVDRIF